MDEFSPTQITGCRTNKVPEITVWFWLIKIMATTVGETAADLLSMKLGLGLGITSAIMACVCIGALALQIGATHYRPSLYWFAVVAISVVGTLVSDMLVDGMGISLVVTSIAFAIVLALVFVAWFASEGTLSIRSVVTTRREAFYWTTILFTFAMGTSVGDLLAETMDLGYAAAALVFAGTIAAVAALRYGADTNAIACFWAAYVLTRPLGASVGDLLAKPHIAGGYGLGTVTTSLIFFGGILALVAYLTISKVDRFATATPEP